MHFAIGLGAFASEQRAHTCHSIVGVQRPWAQRRNTMASNYDWDQHNRHLALEGRQILERTSASLARSNQVAIDTENIGTGVITELDEQRESLLRTQRRLHDAGADLSATNALLRTMKRSIFYNKLTLIMIIVLEACCLAGLLFVKLRK